MLRNALTLALAQRPIDRVPMRATIENIAGVTTRYLHHGSGKYGVLMLHGVGVSADSWLWNLTSLGEKYLAVAPDMLGYGLTGEGSYREGAPQGGIVDHLEALVNHLGMERVLLVGSSFGANVACHLHWRLGSRVDGLVLVGCGPALNSPETLSVMYEQSFANGIEAMSNPTLDVCRRRMKNLVFDPSTVPEALLMIQLTLYALPGARDRYKRRMEGIKTIEALNQYDVTRRMREIAVPTHVVWGRQDIRGNLGEAENCAKQLPMGQLIIYENCGHLPYLEHPNDFNSLIRNILGEMQDKWRRRLRVQNMVEE
jgi:2-hydroxy-6-oxonona-2,4-dienedioate hydrolase